MNLIEIYEAGAPRREPFLEKADALARLTLPELNPRGDYAGNNFANAPANSLRSRTSSESSLGQPFSSAGTSAVTTLGSTTLSLLFPLNHPWYALTVSDEQLKAAKEQAAGLNEGLAVIERRMLDRMLSDQIHVEMLQALLRVFVEGTVLVHKLSGGGLRHIPLRNFIVKRFNGKLVYACMREEMPDQERPYDTKHLYTFIDYQKGEVWQQESDQESPRRVNDKASRYIVVTTSVPTMDDYAPGFAFRYFGLLSQINQISYDMSRAISIAAKAIALIDPESGFTPQEVASLQPGQAIVGRPEWIQWLTAQSKLNEWSWTWQALEALKMELGKNFALGLSQQPELNTDRQTAESVRRLAQELDANAGAIAQVLQQTLQRPLAQAYLEDELEGADDLLQTIKPIVTSGSSAISRLSELQRLMEWVALFQNDPRFQQQYNSIALFRHGAKIIGLPIDDFLSQQGQMPAEGPVPPEGGQL